MEGAAEVAVNEPEPEVPLEEEAGAEEEEDDGGDAKPQDMDKAARRKDANRISAKKSRERKAIGMEAVKKENEDLHAEVAQLKAQLAALQGHAPPPAHHASEHGAYDHDAAAEHDAALPIKKQKR